MSIKEAAERVLKYRQRLQDLEMQLKVAQSDYCHSVGEYLDVTKREEKPLVIDGVLIRRKPDGGRRGYMDALDFEFISVI